METQPRFQPLSHVEQAAAEANERQHRRRLHAAFTTTVALAFACVAWIVPAPIARAGAGIWVVLAVGAWSWVWWCNRGADGRLMRAWQAWLPAASWYEVSRALVLAFREFHPIRYRDFDAALAQRDRDELMQVVLATPIEQSDRVATAMAELITREFDIRASEDYARDVRRQADIEVKQVLADAYDARDDIIRRALEDADDLRQGRAPRHSPHLVHDAAVTKFGEIPSEPPELREKVLRALFQEAAVAADRGVVMESPAAAQVLNNPGRWSPYVARKQDIDALLALFDPACAVDVPPPDRRDGPGTRVSS